MHRLVQVLCSKKGTKNTVLPAVNPKPQLAPNQQANLNNVTCRAPWLMQPTQGLPPHESWTAYASTLFATLPQLSSWRPVRPISINPKDPLSVLLEHHAKWHHGACDEGVELSRIYKGSHRLKPSEQHEGRSPHSFITCRVQGLKAQNRSSMLWVRPQVTLQNHSAYHLGGFCISQVGISQKQDLASIYF